MQDHSYKIFTVGLSGNESIRLPVFAGIHFLINSGRMTRLSWYSDTVGRWLHIYSYTHEVQPRSRSESPENAGPENAGTNSIFQWKLHTM